MGTTSYFGVSYPESTAYVKDGATAMQTIATGFDSAVAIPTYNNQTGTSYTFALVDAAKVVSSNNAGAVTFTIPPQSSVTWTTGATLTVANYGAGSVTIAGGAGVTVTNAGATVSQYGSASIIRTASDAWTVIPFAGGAALLSDSAISGTTGSPTTATYTDGGINYKTYKFTGSGSITLTKAGILDVFIVGGGGATGNYASLGGGGGGGSILTQSVYLNSGTCNVTIGAGGAKPTSYQVKGLPGFASAIGVGTNVWTYNALGGGGGGSEVSTGNQAYTNGISGGSGGGGSGSNNGSAGGLGGSAMLTGMGSAGGAGGTSSGSGGGGGYSAAGSAGSGTTSGAGGNGLGSTIVDGSTTVYYAGGGGGTGGTAGASGQGGGGTANTGGGGTNAAGGSGIVIIRVRA